MAIGDDIAGLQANIDVLQKRLDEYLSENGLVYGFIKELQQDGSEDITPEAVAKLIDRWEAFKANHLGDDSYKQELDVLLTPKDVTTPPNPVITPTP